MAKAVQGQPFLEESHLLIDIDIGDLMSHKKLIEIVRRFFEENADRYNILYVVVYGSVLRRRPSRLGDIDVAVKFSNNIYISLDILLEIGGRLEELTNTRVDIVSVDHVSLPLRYNILVKGRLVYVKDYNTYVRDKWITVLKWLDYKDAYERMHKRIVEAVKKR